MVSVVDVGDGSAVVMQLPHGSTILVDGGSRGDNAKVGSRLVAPFLWKNRISRVEQIIVSHPHTDHFNGVPFLLERFRPKILWVNGTTSREPRYEQLLELARRLDIAIQIPRPGEVLYEDGSTRLRNLAGFHLPYRKQQRGEQPGGDNANHQSLVLRLEHGQSTFLLPGDIGHQEEKLLVQSGQPLKSVVLLAGHHGSSTSNSAIFLAAVAPSSIIVSGREKDGGNTYGWEKARPNPVTTWRTGRNGTVTFSSNGLAWTARPFFP
jgi:competence protein ComEC